MAKSSRGPGLRGAEDAAFVIYSDARLSFTILSGTKFTAKSRKTKCLHLRARCKDWDLVRKRRGTIRDGKRHLIQSWPFGISWKPDTECPLPPEIGATTQ